MKALTKSKAQSVLNCINEHLMEVQKKNEALYAKHNRESFVLNLLRQYDERVQHRWQKIADDLNIEVKMVEAFMACAILHQNRNWNTVNVEVLYGKLFGYCQKNTFETTRVVEGILEHNLNDIVDVYTDDGLVVKVNVALDFEEEEDLDKFQFPLPMVIPPQRISHRSCGYLTLEDRPVSKGVKATRDMPVYDLIRTSRVAFEINEYFLNVDLKFKVKHPEEYQPEYPYQKDWDVAYQSWERKRFRAQVMVQTFQQEGVTHFFFCHRKDGRYRDYCIGMQANEQGTDEDKAQLQFYNKEVVTEEGLKWLKINIANQINPKINGKRADKCSFDERLKWVDDNLDRLEEIVNETCIDEQYPPAYQEQYTAEEPVKAICLVHDLRLAMEGKPIGSICHWDAVNQGLQLQSLLCSDIKMLKMTSVIGNERNDYYVTIALMMGLTEDARKFIKAPTTPRMYGGKGAARDLLGEYYEPYEEAIHHWPVWDFIDQFPEQWHEEWFDQECIRWTLPDCAVTWVPIKKEEHYEGKVYDYEWSWTKNYDDPEGESKSHPTTACSLGPSLIHSLDAFIGREMASRCMFNPLKRDFAKKYLEGKNEVKPLQVLRAKDVELQNLVATGAKFNWYSWHILDLLDNHNYDMCPKEVIEMILSELPEAPFDITRIHDSFGAHPNHAGEIMQQYRWNLYHLYDSKFLDCICEELDIELVTLPKNSMVLDEILKGKYALC